MPDVKKPRPDGRGIVTSRLLPLPPRLAVPFGCALRSHMLMSVKHDDTCRVCLDASFPPLAGVGIEHPGGIVILQGTLGINRRPALGYLGSLGSLALAYPARRLPIEVRALLVANHRSGSLCGDPRQHRTPR